MSSVITQRTGRTTENIASGMGRLLNRAAFPPSEPTGVRVTTFLLGAWAAIVKEVRWHNFLEVRNTFKDTDNVKGYVIFNIHQNRYRLITVIRYAKTAKVRRTQGHVYIRSFLTHKEYDNPANWDRRFATK